MKHIAVLAKSSILLATLIWGTSFVIIKDTLEVINPHYLMAIRFTVAFVVLSAVFFRRMKSITREMIWQGSLIGFFLFLAYLWQTLGIMDTTPGKNAFLTAIYCVIVPFLAWLIKGPKPDKFNVIAAIMCVAGIGLVSLDGDLSVRNGDFYTLIGGFFFACHMVAVAKFVEEKDPIVITLIQFGMAAICFWVTSLIFEGVPQMLSSEAVYPVLYLCFFCTAGALLLQNFGQKYTVPSVAALLLSLESVFGVLFSVVLGREVPTTQMICGFATIFLAIVVSETKLGFLKK